MGLGYFFLSIIILWAAGIGAALLKAAWELWKKPRLKPLAVISLLLAALCAAAAFYLLVLVWREPPWGFHF